VPTLVCTYASGHEAERLARDSTFPEAIGEAAQWRARLQLTLSETSLADPGPAPDHCGVSRSTQACREGLSRVRLLIAREDYEDALRLLDDPLEASGGADGRRGDHELEVFGLRALALWAMGEKARALDVLGRALVIGESEGYVRTFVDEGSAMADLLSEALSSRQRGASSPAGKVPTHYLRKLLAALEREATGAASPARGLLEPLSERELEVLQLIAAGKTNRQVATELFVGVGTVKTHVNNIYRKLNAHGRTQAVARARELALL
jgi:LuxR family maltose regulon positive regulatory protein